MRHAELDSASHWGFRVKHGRQALAAVLPPSACLTQLTNFRHAWNCCCLQFRCIGVRGGEEHNVINLEILASQKERLMQILPCGQADEACGLIPLFHLRTTGRGNGAAAVTNLITLRK